MKTRDLLRVLYDVTRSESLLYMYTSLTSKVYVGVYMSHQLSGSALCLIAEPLRDMDTTL